MAKLKEMDLPIEGMHCASCVLSLNKTFEKVEGVESVDADLASNKLHLTVNPKKLPFDEIETLVKNLGFELHTDEVTLKLNGMHCASCVMNVENFLIRLNGIFDVKADLTSQTARINYDKTKVTVKDMEEVINSLGFEVLGIDGQLEINEDEIYKNDLKDKRKDYSWFCSISCFNGFDVYSLASVWIVYGNNFVNHKYSSISLCIFTYT